MVEKCSEKDNKLNVNNEDLKDFFSNLKEIIDLNKMFLEALEERFVNWWPCGTIGDVFCKFV